MKNIDKLMRILIIMTVYLSLTGCSLKSNVVIQSEQPLDTVSPTLMVQKLQPAVIKTSAAAASSSAGSASKSLSIQFKKTSDTVYATANVNIRSSCSLNQNNIVAVLKKGTSIKRTGIGKEWSKVVYQKKVCYIKSKYLTLKKPAPAVTPVPASKDTNKAASGKDYVADLSLADDVTKLIVVVGDSGPDCTVSFHTKDADGSWKQQFTTAGNCGYNGISYKKKDGDKKTPAGLFSLTAAFGIKADPGALLSYRQITTYDYWVDDMDSPYYNTWVNTLDTPGNFVSEHLIDHNPSYNYAFNINTNPNNTPGLGSAIFLHCFNGKGRTTGCVAISEKLMKSLMKQVDKNTRILIVPNKEDLANYS